MADGMGAQRRTMMDADAFLAWCERGGKEHGRWELVDGVPVQAMAGTTDAHDQIVVNLIIALGTRLRGGPCAPRTADQAVKTRRATRVRRPDVIVDCGPRPPKGLFAPTPTVVFEVLSPSTENVTRSSKVSEYQDVESIQHIVLIAQDAPYAALYTRAANDGWTMAELEGVDGALELSAIGVSLAMADVYADVVFEEEEEEED